MLWRHALRIHLRSFSFSSSLRRLRRNSFPLNGFLQSIASVELGFVELGFVKLGSVFVFLLVNLAKLFS